MARTIPIQLDKERHLLFDLNVAAEIGKRLGIKFKLDSFQRDLVTREWEIADLRTALWCGLKHEDPALTEDAVGAMVDQENLPAVLTSFFSLLGSTVQPATGPSPADAGSAAGSPTPSP